MCPVESPEEGCCRGDIRCVIPHEEPLGFLRIVALQSQRVMCFFSEGVKTVAALFKVFQEQPRC